MGCPESIQGVSTGPCCPSGASPERPALPLGLSAPRGVHHPLLQALHRPLVPSPFPKGIPAWGCPQHSVQEGAGAPPVLKAGAVEPCWSWVFQWDARHRRAWGRDKCQGLPGAETLFKHCHSMSPALAATGTGMHLDFCTDTAQPPASLAVYGHQPQTAFLSL